MILGGNSTGDNPSLKWGDTSNKGHLWTGPGDNDVNIGTKKENCSKTYQDGHFDVCNILTPARFDSDVSQTVKLTDRTSVQTIL